MDEPLAHGRPASAPRLKRALDVILSAAGLIAAFPVIVAIALAILALDGRPVFYRHLRPGLHGEPFELIKFRTMRGAFDDLGRPIPQEERPTRLGYWLRKTSLDEIPELWTILKGQMSLVGPRPLLMEYLALYTPEQARRHEVKPGLTGLAQVMGRHNISWEQRFAYDLYYVDHCSMRLDARIMLMTLRAMTQGDGRRPANYFTGSAPNADPSARDEHEAADPGSTPLDPELAQRPPEHERSQSAPSR